MIDAIKKRLQEGRGEGGFTLIELLIVIVIIAILIAVAIPAFLGARTRGQDSAAKSTLRNAQTAMESYFVDNQTYVGADATEMEAIEGSLTWNTTGDWDTPAGSNNTVGIISVAAAAYQLESDSASGTTFTATKASGIF